MDFTHRKHWWQRAWKSSLSQAGCIQPVSLQRGHYKAAESRAQPHTVHAIEQRRALEPGDQQGLALRASNELQHPGDPSELRMLGLATAGGGRQAAGVVGRTFPPFLANLIPVSKLCSTVRGHVTITAPSRPAGGGSKSLYPARAGGQRVAGKPGSCQGENITPDSWYLLESPS